MKYKLTIAIIITILLIGGGIGENIFVQTSFNTLTERLEKHVHDETFQLEEMEEIAEWWYKRSDILEIFIPHTLLNEITVTFGELIGAVENEDHPSASALLNRIQEYSIRIGEMYQFSINNII